MGCEGGWGLSGASGGLVEGGGNGGGGGEGGGKLVGEGDFGFGSGGSGCLVGWLVRGERGVFGGVRVWALWDRWMSVVVVLVSFWGGT